MKFINFDEVIKFCNEELNKEGFDGKDFGDFYLTENGSILYYKPIKPYEVAILHRKEM